MYRLLIVEDEEFTRDQIRNAVNWEHMNIEIVGEAENGLDGLKLAEQFCPDIVLCDIKMPHMDGISFATELSGRFPSLQIIFLSGYSNREYMQNAIRLHAADYIFKPFTLSELTAALEKAIHQLQQTVSGEQNKTDSELALHVLYHASSPDFQGYLSRLSLPIDLGLPYLVMLIRLNSGIYYANSSSAAPHESLELQNYINEYSFGIDAEISKIFGDAFLMSKCGNGYVILTNAGKDMDRDFLTKHLSVLFSRIKDVPSTIGVSGTQNTPEALPLAFREARNASLSAFLKNYGQVLFIEDCRRSRFSPEHKDRQGYFEHLEAQDIPRAGECLNRYFLYLSTCSPEDITGIRDDLLSLALHLNKKLKNSPYKLIGEFINLASTLEDIRQYLQHLLSLYQAELKEKGSRGKIIYDAEKYILSHLSEPLSVKDIADHVYASTTYLCFLYKKQTGRTIREFILEMRMQKAKSLLLDSNMKIGDIAASLGYTNQNYFTRAFVSYYGTTPSKYRNKEY